MSGELKSMYDYEPPDPTKVEKPRRRRRERRVPTTRGAVILHGLARLAVLLGGSVGAVVLIGWLVARHSGSPLERCAADGLLHRRCGRRRPRAARRDRRRPLVPLLWRLRAGRKRPAATRGQQLVFFGLLALFLFGLGLALDYLL